MFSCWFLSPKDRPSFETLCCELEKVLEELPDPQDPDEILYVNMEESSGEIGAVGGRDPNCPLGSLSFGGGGGGLSGLAGLSLPLPPMKDSVATVEVHQPLQPNRYVLCPQHETPQQRPLLASADSLESLHLPPPGGPHSATCSNSASPTPTLRLQPSECSSPAPPLDLDDDDALTNMGPAAVRRVPWQ